MGKYQIYAGASYYPSGGADDFHSDEDSLEKAKEVAANLIGKSFKTVNTFFEDETSSLTIDWAQVFDSSEKLVVARFGGSLEVVYKTVWSEPEE